MPADLTDDFDVCPSINLSTRMIVPKRVKLLFCRAKNRGGRVVVENKEHTRPATCGGFLASRSRITLANALTGLALLVTALLVAWHAVHARRAGPLWRDEAHVVNWASLPSLAEVWSHRHLDPFPATWPMLVHEWILLAGGNDASLRALGAMIGIAGLAALWWTARQFGGRAPLLSLVLYAANPCVLVYGGSVRGYGFALFALVLFLGTVARAVARPRWRTLAVAQLAALLVAQTDFRNCVFVLSGLAGAAAVAAWRGRWKFAALVLALGAIPLLSLLPYVSTYQIVSQWFVISQQDWSYSVLFKTFSDLLRAAGAGMFRLWWLVVLLSLAACAREFLPSRQPPCPAARDRVLFLLVALAIGVPGIFLVLHFLRLVTHIWYYQALVAVLATCADGAFAVRGEASRPATGARLALAACAIVLGAHATWNSRAFLMTNADVIAARLDEQAAPADLIVVTPYQMSASFERYYRGLAPWITLPEVPDHHFQDPSAFKEKMSRRDPIRTELDRIAATLRAGHRVWMVGSLKFPNAEATLPHLPPAPAPETGWLDVPYINAWSAEAGAVVAREARTIRVVAPRSAGLVNRFENTRLLVAEP